MGKVAPDFERARKQARELVRGNYRYKEMVQLITEASGVSERTAKNYISRARTDVLLVECELDVGDLDDSRWKRILDWDRRSNKYRMLADSALELTVREAKNQHYRQGRFYENLSLKYETMIAKALHWFQIPPDRDMELPEVRALVLRSLERHLPKFPRGELFDLHAYLGRLLEDQDYSGDDEELTSEVDQMLQVPQTDKGSE
jgi:hypothetical protein